MSGIKKQYYRPRPNNRPKHFLEAGQRGFFCTCNFREKDCVKEAYNLLNEYGDKLYGSSKENASQKAEKQSQDEVENAETGEVDISDQLKMEVAELKTESKKNIWERRFQAVETGAANCVFIRTNLPKPEEITAAIFKELMETKVTKTRYLLRILPIMATCKANMLDITQTGGKLFDDHFLKEPSTFSIIFNKRYHSKITRDDVIKELAELITMKNCGNKADLKNPKKAVIVEIIKGICLMSVVENFFTYRKYNMFEICKKEDEKPSEGADETEDVKKEDGGMEHQPAETEDIDTEKDKLTREKSQMETQDSVNGTGDSTVADKTEQKKNEAGRGDGI